MVTIPLHTSKVLHGTVIASSRPRGKQLVTVCTCWKCASTARLVCDQDLQVVNARSRMEVVHARSRTSHTPSMPEHLLVAYVGQ